MEVVNTFENQQEIKNWVNLCRHHSGLICKELQVPDGILPKGVTGTLINVHVEDEKIYTAHENLRHNVARGNCVLELKWTDEGEITTKKYIFLIFGLKKFSGGAGDEDEHWGENENHRWPELYWIKLSSDKIKKVVCTEKVNGDTVHLSCIKLFDQNYFCIGSKNFHILIQNKDDITRYTDTNFDFAKRGSHAFFSTFMDNAGVAEHKKESFLAFLQESQLTTVFEMMDPENQHIVDLSHLKHTELRFICWTKADLRGNFTGTATLCSLPIDEAIEKAKSFGLQTIAYDVMDFKKDSAEKVAQYYQKIRREHGYEGKVFYFLDKENRTIGLLKKKTVWYIMLRALREDIIKFASSKYTPTLGRKVKKVTDRIEEIQKYLKLSFDYACCWTEIAIRFIMWLHSDTPSTLDAGIRSNFPGTFNKYLNEDEKRMKIYKKLGDKFDDSEM